MKVIDLLNKIANGEEIPKKINYKGTLYEYCEDVDYKKRNGNYLMNNVCICPEDLNNEVEIIEEEKKMPEKIKVKDYVKCIYDVTHKEKEFSLDIRELQIRYNNLLDYLKSKGE